MTKEQIKHYLKGGKFTAVFKPVMLDLSEENKEQIGKQVECHQNVEVSPVREEEYSPDVWVGQHRFDTDLITGYVLEEDLSELTIVNEFIDTPEMLPVHQYNMIFTTREQLVANFGNDVKDTPLPYIAVRNYGRNMDEYIIKLCKPAPTRIDKRLWNYQEVSKWEVLLGGDEVFVGIKKQGEDKKNWLLDAKGEPLSFKDAPAAVEYLMDNGYMDDQLVPDHIFIRHHFHE